LLYRVCGKPSDLAVDDIRRFVPQDTVSNGYISSRRLPTLAKYCCGNRRIDMLGWSITFLVIALIAAFLGFTGVAIAAAGIAKLLFVIFLVLFLVSLIAHLGGRRSSI
jgi:uncharacterized membrane protein YtjA (UPF0391 family)